MGTNLPFRLLTIGWLVAVAGLFAMCPLGNGFAPAPEARGKFTNGVGMKLVRIKPGKFTMGSPVGEDMRDRNEIEHEVEITKAFFIGAHEVTQAQYRKVMGKNPSSFSAKGTKSALVRALDTGPFPVEQVSWDDAAAFFAKLSNLPAEKAARRSYRLPTEAEWEFACRAGAKEKAPFNLGKSMGSTLANFDGGYPYGAAGRGPYLERTAAAGSYKRPSPLGLYDMHGNVWEWCADWYDEGYYKVSPKKDPKGPATGREKVIRGGAFFNHSKYLRSASRMWCKPTDKGHGIGFRAACEVGK
jgi:formylglycine-generating enzyme required for sulfatase activity